jgi:GNAT superfamily N-acetyltransferase
VRIVRAGESRRSEAQAVVEEYCDAIGVAIRDEPEDFAQYFRPGGGIWLASESGSVVGCIALRPLAGHLNGAEIKRLYVREGHRGRGLAAALLAALHAGAKAYGYREIYLDTKDDLTAATRFYERNGYERCERYNENPQATIFMRRRL